MDLSTVVLLWHVCSYIILPMVDEGWDIATATFHYQYVLSIF